ncbi:MAG: response regulator [Candidatus Omnitrophota bacterium]|jgi:CheY-like chemotaxis protein
MRENLPIPVIEVLLIEDNPGDVRLMQEVFKDSCVRNNLWVAQDGVQALEFLRRQGVYEHAARPALILLDLNLPKKDGRQVLSEIKEDQELKSIPVLILTTSDAEEDVHNSYALHANCYITKPFNLEEFIQIVKIIERFWMGVVLLPSTRASM